MSQKYQQQQNSVRQYNYPSAILSSAQWTPPPPQVCPTNTLLGEWVNISLCRFLYKWQYRDWRKPEVGTMPNSNRMTVFKTALHTPVLWTVWSTIYAQPFTSYVYQANTRRWPNAVSALGQRLIFTGYDYTDWRFNPFKPEFTIVIFIHYKPRIAVAILDL